eukprot:TRINITY_DN13294_c0_g1_i2.p1 TRINITY_DN13294_c0_g1~~TRINITY_DN13294_c0_g1_i2.p1  ORF type:complete len:217 (-),score=8.89 TRINITY_DN13294_c0_g1_i2:102-752(-)
MQTLVTFGGQHQGVMNIPGCMAAVNSKEEASSILGYLCQSMQYLLGLGAYLPYVQSRSIQAQYFKDPFDFVAYIANSIFLAEMNNDKEDKNEKYASNLATLDKFVMIKFLNDTMVVPKESAWFGYYNGSELLTLFEQPIYKEDWIGLKQLNEKNSLVFIEKLGNHRQADCFYYKNAHSPNLQNLLLDRIKRTTPSNTIKTYRKKLLPKRKNLPSQI